MNTFDILYPTDPNGFIESYVRDSEKARVVPCEVNWKNNNGIEHAIVFDDGEEFSAERLWLAQRGTPTRWIKTPLTRVINLRREPEYQKRRRTAKYEYIGRGSTWGNPYSMLEENESREEVVRKYRYDFDHDLFPRFKKTDVLRLGGKRLGCFCKPAMCHGDVLADYLNRYDDGN
jgi:hypothetical protein